MKLKHFFDRRKYIFFFFIGLAAAICSEFLLIKNSTNLIFFNQAIEISTIFSFLTALWFIAWLLESFLEIMQKIFQIDRFKEANQPSPKIARFTATTGFLISLIIACAGVRTLSQFFIFSSSSAQPISIQKMLFDCVDIVLTASVIAAGSKGIHELTNAYKGLMQKFEDLTRDNQSHKPTNEDLDSLNGKSTNDAVKSPTVSNV